MDAKIAFNAPFALEEKALNVHETRASILTHNITHANTPNYKSKDINFRDILKQSTMNTPALSQTHSGHMALSQSSNGYRVENRTNVETSMNGNTVNSQMERAEFIENAIRYQASLAVTKNKAASLIKAFKGE